MKRKASVLCMLAFAASPVMAQEATSGSGWEWEAGPYGWAASVSTDLNASFPGIAPDGGPIIPSLGDYSNTRRFVDIVDKLDGVFMGHLEGRGQRIGLFADVMYLGLAQERGRALFRIDSDLDMRLYEAALVWRVGNGHFSGLELFGGTRIIDVDFTTQFTPANPAFLQRSVHGEDTLYDGMVGVRYSFPLSDRWSLTLRGDGSWGDTDGTWNASAMTRLATHHGAWYFGYRYLNIDVRPGGQALSVDLHGPVVGYGFTF